MNGTTGNGTTGWIARVFVPGDSAARAVGSDMVAAAIIKAFRAMGLACDLVRNGSRGLCWLEPMVEIETSQGRRLAFGPITAGDVEGLVETWTRADKALLHPLCLGPTDALVFLERQQRLVFARCGLIDPLSLDDYRCHGGLKGLEMALTQSAETVVETLTASGLRGRGGAGFPTGIKLKTVLQADGAQKYIVCNADEGDSGTFADRMIMEGDPFVVIEGMVIAGLACGASKGFIYIRSEYPDAIRVMGKAVDLARDVGIVGKSVLSSGKVFEIEIRVGAGSYVCGEETALLESLEGRRGVVRAKPPLPAHEGLFGQPSAVNNVISLASIPLILAKGAAFFRDFGIGRSRGTVPIQLAGNVRYPGLFEAAFGLTLGEIVEEIGGGTASGRPVRAVQVGGPLGAYFPRSLFDTVFDYEAFAARDGLIGHAGIVVFDDTVDLWEQARFAFEFCAIESCGKCTPCRIGSLRGVEVMDRLALALNPDADLALLGDLCNTMKFGSLCALGGFVPFPVMSAITHFPEDFRDRAKRQKTR